MRTPTGPDRRERRAGRTASRGIAGVTVALIQDLNGNGVWDAGEPIIATTMTDVTGKYAFPGLPVRRHGYDDYLVWVNDTDNVLGGPGADLRQRRHARHGSRQAQHSGHRSDDSR